MDADADANARQEASLIRKEKAMLSTSPVRNDLDRTARRSGTALLMFGALVIAMFAASDASAQSLEREAAAAGAGPTRSSYQAYLAADCLPGSNFCKFISETVPARGVLEIQRVACQGWHTSASLPSFVVIGELRTSADAYIGRIDFFRTTYDPANGGSVWTISEQTLLFIPANHKFRITLNSGTTGVGSYGCTISGYLTIS